MRECRERPYRHRLATGHADVHHRLRRPSLSLEGRGRGLEALRARPDMRGLIVGGHAQEPDLARVKALAASSDCATRVTITGLSPPAAWRRGCAHADVLVLPNTASAISTRFTSPLKLFEYLALGGRSSPRDLPAIREVLHDGDDGAARAARRCRRRWRAAIRRVSRTIRRSARGSRAQRARDVRDTRGRARRTARGAVRRGDRGAPSMISPACSRSCAAPTARLAARASPRRWLPLVRRGRTTATAAGFLDLRPREAFAEQTKYLDEALHADARHERSRRRCSDRRSATTCCGVPAPRRRRIASSISAAAAAGRWCGTRLAARGGRHRHRPFFAREARRDVDLLLGDLRRLPFADGTFTKAWSLDVLEHLSPEALRGMLGKRTACSRRAARCSSTRTCARTRRSPSGCAGQRARPRDSSASGLLDLRQERLRKSDHLNPLPTSPSCERVAARRRFRIERIRYYTPLVGGFVENILVRIAERRDG